MSEPFAAESPLAEFFGSTRPPIPDEPSGAVLTERPPHGQLNLRGDPARPAFLDGVRRALGFDLPLDPNTTADADDLAALWLGPDEWLILTPDDRAEAVAGRLRAEFRAEFAAITDVSAASAVIRLTGPRVRDVLAAGCPLDLHPRAFHVGRCAQTILAKATATIVQVDDAPTFDLFVRRSFADYVARWLEDAGREFDLVVARTSAR